MFVIGFLPEQCFTIYPAVVNVVVFSVMDGLEVLGHGISFFNQLKTFQFLFLHDFPDEIA